MDKPIRIPEGHGDAFAACLRTLPDDEAVTLLKHAVNESPHTKHNQRELYRSREFFRWALEIDAKGLFGTPTIAQELAAQDIENKED